MRSSAICSMIRLVVATLAIVFLWWVESIADGQNV